MPTWNPQSLQSVTAIGNTTTVGIQFLGANVKAKFGAAGEAEQYYDGANLIIDPKVSGSGYLGVGATGNANINASHIGLGDDAPASNMIIKCSESNSTVVQGIVSTLVHSGSTALVRGVNIDAQHGGTNTTQQPIGANITATLNVKNGGTASVVGVNVLSRLAAGVVITNGSTVDLYNKFDIGGDTAGHTSGTVRAKSIWATEPPQFTGGAGVTTWAGLFSGDLQVNQGKKLILSGSDTIKGTSYWTSTASTMDAYVSSTQTLTIGNRSLNILDATNISFGTSSGGMIGTSPSQKIGAWGSTPIVQPSAIVQTYATSSKTHATPTATSIATTASTQTSPWGYASQAQADAIPTAINSLITDLANVKQVMNAIIDDLQAIGWFK